MIFTWGLSIALTRAAVLAAIVDGFKQGTCRLEVFRDIIPPTYLVAKKGAPDNG